MSAPDDSAESDDVGGLPPSQFLAPDVVLVEMAEVGAKRSMSLSISQVLILSTMAGAFITAGALFSTLIQPLVIGPGWGEALAWGILPAAIGNVLGAFFLVALPFWLVSRRRPDSRL
jgi:formate/nitrite transporter FocA (FNT family)